MSEKDKEVNPETLFEEIKSKKQKVTDADLVKVYDNCLALINKYKITGQTQALKKLIFHLESIENEREIVKAGIDTFVYLDDLDAFIDSRGKKYRESNGEIPLVNIIELERFERDIPDDIVAVLEKVKPLFTKFYVVFTDYTGKVARQIKKEEIKRDPILFGMLLDKKSGAKVERAYYIGDWVDEYCDLTLDKMVTEWEKDNNSKITHTISTPKDIEELKQQLSELDTVNNLLRVVEKEKSDKSKTIFSKLVNTFKTKKVSKVENTRFN